MVCVDVPQGYNSSTPPIAEATTQQSYLRLHGRNTTSWGQPGSQVRSIYDYWYSDSELQEWLDRVRQLEERSDRVYVLFNTVQGLETAQQMQKMIA